MDGPESGWSVESGRSWVKADGLLRKSERSQDEVDGPSESERSVRKWTVLQKVDCSSESGRSLKIKDQL